MNFFECIVLFVMRCLGCGVLEYEFISCNGFWGVGYVVCGWSECSFVVVFVCFDVSVVVFVFDE